MLYVSEKAKNLWDLDMFNSTGTLPEETDLHMCLEGVALYNTELVPIEGNHKHCLLPLRILF